MERELVDVGFGVRVAIRYDDAEAVHGGILAPAPDGRWDLLGRDCWSDAQAGGVLLGYMRTDARVVYAPVDCPLCLLARAPRVRVITTAPSPS